MTAALGGVGMGLRGSPEICVRTAAYVDSPACALPSATLEVRHLVDMMSADGAVNIEGVVVDYAQKNAERGDLLRLRLGLRGGQQVVF